MQFKTIFVLVLALVTVSIGCGEGTTTTPTGGTNTNLANTNAASPAANTDLGATKKPDAATTNDAPTLAPVVQAYYEALKKKDDALLKSVMSQAFIKSVEDDM